MNSAAFQPMVLRSKSTQCASGVPYNGRFVEFIIFLKKKTSNMIFSIRDVKSKLDKSDCESHILIDPFFL